MATPSFARSEIEIITPGTKTVYGQTTDDWTESKVTRRKIQRCLVDGASVEELADRNRATTMDAWNLQLNPWETPPTSRDKVKLPNGNEYQVQGEPRLDETPSGTRDVWRLWLERWKTNG